MQAVVLINAAPGFEDGVEAAVRKIDGVEAIERVKKGNYDLAVLLDVEDAAAVQSFIKSQLRSVTGFQGAELVDRPSPQLLERLVETE